jgi:hypothetical protein
MTKALSKQTFGTGLSPWLIACLPSDALRTFQMSTWVSTGLNTRTNARKLRLKLSEIELLPS